MYHTISVKMCLIQLNKLVIGRSERIPYYAQTTYEYDVIYDIFRSCYVIIVILTDKLQPYLCHI